MPCGLVRQVKGLEAKDQIFDRPRIVQSVYPISETGRSCKNKVKVGRAGFLGQELEVSSCEPATSWSRTKNHSQARLPTHATADSWFGSFNGFVH